MASSVKFALFNTLTGTSLFHFRTALFYAFSSLTCDAVTLLWINISCLIKLCFFSNADVVEGSRSYENIFVSGGALLADDMILKTIDIGKNTFEMFVVVVNQTAENNEKLKLCNTIGIIFVFVPFICMACCEICLRS